MFFYHYLFRTWNGFYLQLKIHNDCMTATHIKFKSFMCNHYYVLNVFYIHYQKIKHIKYHFTNILYIHILATRKIIKISSFIVCRILF